jgi:hypothetical protein
LKPLARQTSDLFERARLLEKMRGARDNFQAIFDVVVLEGFEMLEGLAVHLDDGSVLAAYDQQRRSPHAIEHRDGEVRPPAA